MKATYSISLLIVLAVGTLGCASSGVNFSEGAFTQLQVGNTTAAQVSALLGKPLAEETASFDGVESVMKVYSYSKNTFELYSRTNVKSLHLEFIKGILNGLVYNNSFADSSTDFDSALRDSLVVGQSTKQKSVSLFGLHYGEVRLPTNLLNRTMPELYTRKIPQSAVEALVYYYRFLIEVERRGGHFANHYKLLVLYFDNNGLLVDKAFTENVIQPQ